MAIGEKSVSNEADRIANDLMMGMRDLDRKDRELIKDWIYEGVHAGKEISGEILNWIMRGAPKTITTDLMLLGKVIFRCWKILT